MHLTLRLFQSKIFSNVKYLQVKNFIVKYFQVFGLSQTLENAGTNQPPPTTTRCMHKPVTIVPNPDQEEGNKRPSLSLPPTGHHQHWNPPPTSYPIAKLKTNPSKTIPSHQNHTHTQTPQQTINHPTPYPAAKLKTKPSKTIPNHHDKPSITQHHTQPPNQNKTQPPKPKTKPT